jgi:hypothetical protein
MAKKVFWILVGNFILILSQLFVPVVGEVFEGSLLFLLPFVTLFLLGVILALFTVKEKVKGNLRAFLLITGISSSGLFVGV